MLKGNERGVVRVWKERERGLERGRLRNQYNECIPFNSVKASLHSSKRQVMY